MTRPSLPRALVATTATIAVTVVGYLVALVGRGRYLEDLCLTREPEGAWAPREFTVVRGPVPDGLIGFRCESAAAPRYHFGFTDPLPLLATCAVAAAVLAVALLVWVWALRGSQAPAARPTAGQD